MVYIYTYIYGNEETWKRKCMNEKVVKGEETHVFYFSFHLIQGPVVRKLWIHCITLHCITKHYSLLTSIDNSKSGVNELRIYGIKRPEFGSTQF